MPAFSQGFLGTWQPMLAWVKFADFQQKTCYFKLIWAATNGLASLYSWTSHILAYDKNTCGLHLQNHFPLLATMRAYMETLCLCMPQPTNGLSKPACGFHVKASLWLACENSLMAWMWNKASLWLACQSQLPACMWKPVCDLHVKAILWLACQSQLMACMWKPHCGLYVKASLWLACDSQMVAYM